MNSKMRNVIRKHRKAKRRLAARRKEGLAIAAASKKSRRGRKPKLVVESQTETLVSTNENLHDT